MSLTKALRAVVFLGLLFAFTLRFVLRWQKD